MTPYRIQAKYFIKRPEAVSLPALIPVFHRWIQEHSVGGLLIDVADYKHVHEGPGVLLIGHEGDYALDLGEGRPGLLYRRKRPLAETLQDVLSAVFHQVLLGCHLLEGEPTLQGRVTFDAGEVEVTFLDRLRVPNEHASLDLVRDDLEAVLATLYDDTGMRLAWTATDPRLPFAVRAHAAETPALNTLVRRLEQYA